MGIIERVMLAVAALAITLTGGILEAHQHLLAGMMVFVTGVGLLIFITGASIMDDG